VFQTRFHGRGGQGVVTAAELLSVAAFNGGKHAQAFPNFGSERTGAPVVAYCRIDEHPIRVREPIMVPDALIVQDATLLLQLDLLSGLPQDCYVLINTAKTFDAMGMSEFVESHDASRLMTVPATDIALRAFGRPLPNAALLGGLAALTGIVDIDNVCDAILERFGPKLGNANANAAREAYEWVGSERKGNVNASAN
jgi:pyruvate ferredoxin oxidoreductase gamma subunit